MHAATLPPDLPTQPCHFTAAAEPTPALRTSAWQQISRALGWPAQAKRPPIVTSEARAAFVACLADVPTFKARVLSERLRHTHSLSELWQLRPEMFQLLALHHTQAEAQRRVDELAQRFDRRAKPRAPGLPTRPA